MFRLFLYLYIVKAKEFIYNVKTILLEGNSAAAEFSDQHLMYMLDEARATLAGRRLEKAHNVEQMTQIIDVTPTIVNPETANEIGTVGDTRVLKVDLPQPVRYHNREAIFTVGSTDGQDSYTPITYSQLRTALYRKYTAKSPKWFWYEHSLYIINSEIDSRKKIRVRGIFSEPYKVEIANGKYKKLAPFDWEYPLSLNDANTVYQLAFGADLGWVDLSTGAIAKAQRDREEAQQRRNKNAKAQQASNTSD